MRPLLLVTLLCLSCSSSDDSNSASTTDTGVAVDGSTDTPADGQELIGHKCGDPPYVKWSGRVMFNDVGGAKPAAGAVLESPACPGAPLTLPADGTFAVLLTKGARTHATAVKAGAINTLMGEWAPDKDETNIEFSILPPIFAGLVPEWDSSSAPAVLLSVSARETSGPCSTKDGASFSVKDQPGAVVSYMSDESIPTAIPGATASSKRGLVTFTKMTGASIEIVGTKPGCKVSTVTRLQSGKVILKPTFMTTLVAYVTNG